MPIIQAADTESNSRVVIFSRTRHPAKLPNPPVKKLNVAIEAPSHNGGNPVSPAPKAAGMQFRASVSPKAMADVRPIEVICCASCLEKSVYMPIAIKSRAPNRLAVFCISTANKEDAQQRTKLTRPEIRAIHALILVPISLPWHPYAMPIQRLSRLVASAKMKMETLCTHITPFIARYAAHTQEVKHKKARLAGPFI